MDVSLFVVYFLMVCLCGAAVGDMTRSSPINYFRYIPISPQDRDWGLFVTTAGHTRTAPGGLYPPTQHPHGYHFSWERGRVLHEYQVVYITQGGGVFESASVGRRTIEAGDAFLLFPDVWHRYAPHPSTGWEEYWVGLDGEYMQRLAGKGFFSADAPIRTPGHEPALVDLFVQLIDLLQREPMVYQQVMAATVHLLLARICAAEQSRGAARDDIEAAIRQAKCLLMERLNTSVDLEAMAQELGIGYVWFRQMFKRYTGLPPHQYHLQLRIHRARQLLAGTTLSVKEVAHQVGFDDVHYFCRIFRKKTGKSPAGWRQYTHGPESASR